MSRFLPGRDASLALGASIASGILLALAFPRFDVGPLALVALIPLLWAWRDASPGRAALYGFVFGLSFFGVLMYWLWYFGALPILFLVAACSAYTALTGLLVGWLGRLGLRSPWITAAAWVLPETLRGRWPLGGMPWGEVGAALHDVPWGRAVASWGGVALVSFAVVGLNGALLDVLLAVRFRSARRVAYAAVSLTVMIAVVAMADIARFTPTPAGRLRVAMLQGNDHNRHLEFAEQDAYLPASHLRLAAALDGRYDLIVFPESSLGQTDPEVDPGLREQIIAVARAHHADVLVNAAEEVPGPDDRVYNTNLLYEPSGKLQGKYAKEHLVPFGEYVPWRRYLSFIHALEQIKRDFKPGRRRTLFEIGGHRVGTVICFESAFGPLVRDFVRKGAETIIVTTNNASYRRSANSAQHLALSQMRAAETGRPVVHASVSGISAVIDADGEVRHQTRLFRNTVVTSTVITTKGETPYVRFGDWAVLASGLVLLGAAAVGALRRRAGTFPRLASAMGGPSRRMA